MILYFCLLEGGEVVHQRILPPCFLPSALMTMFIQQNCFGIQVRISSVPNINIIYYFVDFSVHWNLQAAQKILDSGKFLGHKNLQAVAPILDSPSSDSAAEVPTLFFTVSSCCMITSPKTLWLVDQIIGKNGLKKSRWSNNPWT